MMFVSFNSNTMGVTCGAGTDYLPGCLRIRGICVAQSPDSAYYFDVFVFLGVFLWPLVYSIFSQVDVFQRYVKVDTISVPLDLKG